MIDNIKFWYHPLIGGTGIQGLIETCYGIEFEKFDISKVDVLKKNIITFFWETTTSINLEFKTNNSDFFDLLNQLNKLNFYFLADYTTESNDYVDDERIIFLDKLKLNNIHNFFIVTNNSDKNLNTIQYGEYVLKHLHLPHFLLSTPTKMKSYIDNFSFREMRNPSNDFLCLNRRMLEHKFYFLNRLSELDLLQNTNFTWVCNKFDLNSVKDTSIINELNIDVDNFKPIQLEGDILYGEELDTADEFLYTINPNWYYDCKVNFVVETNGPGNLLHLTEKTWKPIFLEIPFVCYAVKKHLEKLNEFGFDTFESIIGKYDCSDIDSVISAGIRLAQNYDNQSVIEICKKNKSVLLDKSNQQRIISEYFLDKIE